MKPSIDNDLRILRDYQATVTTGVLIDEEFFSDFDDVDYSSIESAKFDLMISAVGKLTNMEQIVEQLSEVVNDMKVHLMNRAYEAASSQVLTFYPELESEIVSQVRRRFSLV